MILKAPDHIAMPFARTSRYILVSERSAIDLFTTAMLLQRFNYTICTARNPHHALDMIAVAMPALVIADLELPGMSGTELLRVLASNAHTRNIPAILLLPPAETEKIALDDAMLASFHCIRKPVDVEDFYRRVQTVMERTPRKHLRVSTVLPVILNDAPLDGERGECATHISSQGMFIRTFKYHGPEEDLSLQLAIGGSLVRAKASVIYTRRQDAGLFAEPGIAVRFTRIEQADREIIQQFVRREILKDIMINTV